MWPTLGALLRLDATVIILFFFDMNIAWYLTLLFTFLTLNTEHQVNFLISGDMYSCLFPIPAGPGEVYRRLKVVREEKNRRRLAGEGGASNRNDTFCIIF